MKTEKKSIFDYLSKNSFLIPMYQRAYVWDEDECEQLWNDVYHFYKNKDSDEEYFLGSIVMYKENHRLNLIDGQQRTTTFSLFIRALFEKARRLRNIDNLKKDLAACLWDIDLIRGDINFSQIHLQSQVATEFDNQALNKILSDKMTIESDIKKQSLCEKNYLYFKEKIDNLSKDEPNEWFNFCICFLHSCIVLPIECDGQDNALKIFNTINNRGTSLSVSDIFKGIIFQSKNQSERLRFAASWKDLESEIQNSIYLRKENIDFLFAQYEHILRAYHNEIDTVIPSTLDFWTKKDKLNSKKKKVNFAANDNLLIKDETFTFIQKLGIFWCDPYVYLTPKARKYFHILTTFQNKLWQMVVSMCFYELEKCKAKEDIFEVILPQVVSYCALGYIYSKGGGGGLFWGFMRANVLIKDGQIAKIFEPSLNFPTLKMPSLDHFIEFSKKAIPKQIRFILSINALLYSDNQEWEWNKNGKNYSVHSSEIEHILPKKWQNTNYCGWNEDEAKEFLEHIGNKILIEKKLNLLAGNDYFKHKKETYKHSNFLEVKNLGNCAKYDWTKEDILERNREIYERIKNFIEENLKPETK